VHVKFQKNGGRVSFQLLRPRTGGQYSGMEPKFLPTDSRALKNLITSVAEVIDHHGRERTNGKVASERTFRQNHEVMTAFCRRLHKLGFAIEGASQLRRTHIESVVQDWWRDGISQKTMQNQLSRVRIFCGWIGKPDMVARGNGVAQFLPDVDPAAVKVKTIAEKTKSWTGNGLDAGRIIRAAMAEDFRHAAMLALGLTFGLRKKEMLLIKPWKADKTTYLEITDNVGKNGKYRQIPIEDGEFGQSQRAALEMAKKACRKSEYLGWPEMSLKAAENRYYYLMKRLGLTKTELGVTGHGARAEYAELTLLLQGVVPPTLGGQANQMPKADIEDAMLKVSGAMGHNDLHATGAYYGSYARPQSMNPLGGRIGPTLILDSVLAITCQIWANPAPRPDEEGTDYIPRSSRSKVVGTAMIDSMDGIEQKMSLSELVERWPGCREQVLGQLAGLKIEHLIEQEESESKNTC
jgi:site-specific recombinase XerC